MLVVKKAIHAAGEVRLPGSRFHLEWLDTESLQRHIEDGTIERVKEQDADSESGHSVQPRAARRKG